MMIRFDEDEEEPSGALLAYVAATVTQQLLPQNEYLVAENTILRVQLRSRLLLTDPQQSALAKVPTNAGLELLN